MPNTRRKSPSTWPSGRLERARRRLLDRHSLRHRRPPRQDVPDRLERHQRSHDRRKRAGAGRLCQTGPLGRDAVVRDRLRHAASLAALRRAVRRDHGGRRLHGLLSRRLSQHAGAVVPGALQEVLLRHHGHGQPQSAQRQRGEGLLVDRRTTAAAARPGRDRPRDVDRRRSTARRLPTRCRTAKSSSARTEVDPAYIAAVKAQGLRRTAGDRRSSIRRCTAWARRRSCRRWRPTALPTSSCSARTPSRTAIFRMCRATSRIRRTRRCSTRSSLADGRSAPT